VNAAETVRRQCLARTPLADFFRILLGYFLPAGQAWHIWGRDRSQCTRQGAGGTAPPSSRLPAKTIYAASARST